MDKGLRFIIEVLGVLLLLFVVSNLVGKYYFHTSAFEYVLEQGNSPERKLSKIERQMKRDEERYTNLLSNISIKSVANEKTSAIPILVYHGITRDENDLEDKTEEISLNNFVEQMMYLKKEGYTTVSLEQYEEFMNGDIDLPHKSFILTFDDGIKSSYYNADPVLKALGYKAVMYIITKHSIGKENSPYYLSQSEVVTMHKSGRWDIQSHGKEDHNLIQVSKDGKKGHFMTKRMWLTGSKRFETEQEFKARITKDLIDSKNEIEMLLGNKVISYAFPFGDYGTDETAGEILDITSKVYSKYMIQFKTDKRTGYFRNNFRKNPDKALVRRIKSAENVSATEFANSMEASLEKKLPFSSNFFQTHNENWVSSNGNLNYSISKGILSIDTASKSANLTVFLDGAYLWKNYTLEAKAKLVKGKSFSVIGRAFDGNNMVACTYNVDGVTLDQKVDGERIVLGKTGSNYRLTLSDGASVGIRTKGEYIECLYENQVIVSGVTKKDIRNGGIGFGAYSGEQIGAKVEISDVKVYYK